ncbi:hypothetical protein ACFCX4_36205 [Kitasatospora sp. NPDC056327]|uniref:hypothetical protein n=1 Tax=Kitasatospora sp. NPDC056327 TaxID=3345785 RepID=UPI0035DB8826
MKLVHLLIQAVLLLAGLTVTALGFRLYNHMHETMTGHLTAPVCGTAAATPGTECTEHKPLRVKSKEHSTTPGGDSGLVDVYELKVVPEGSSHTKTYFADEDIFDRVSPGSEITVAVYRGREFEISYQGFRTDVRYWAWREPFLLALIIGPGSVLTTMGLAWARREMPDVPSAVVLAVSVAFTLIYVFAYSPAVVESPVWYREVPATMWLIMIATAGIASHTTGTPRD